MNPMIAPSCTKDSKRRGGNIACSEPRILELRMVKSESFAGNCKNYEMGGGKDSIKYVVGGFCGRGCPTSTRSEGLVVWDVVSCLRDVTEVGIDIEGFDSKIWKKSRLLIKYGGICRSKESSLQGYHQS